MYKMGFGLLCLVLLFSPLAFGTVEIWSMAIMEISVLGAFFFVMIALAGKGGHSLRKVPGLLPLSLYAGFILIQVVPLPPFLIRLLSPAAYEIYDQTVWVLSQGDWVTLSLHKKATILAFFRLLSYMVIYILTLTFLSHPKPIKIIITIIISFASLLALSSIVSHFVSPDLVLGGRETPSNAQPFGPYVNRNHYTSFMNMVLPVVVALLFVFKPKIYSKDIRERISEIIASREANIQALLWLSFLLISGSVILSLSRGGILTLAIALMFLGAVISLRSLKRVPVILLVFGVLLLTAGWFGWEALYDRFTMLDLQENGAMELRPRIWANSFSIIKQFPLVGVGLGSFQYIYRTLPDIVYELRVEHAHSDYLELLVNCGIIGTGFALWFIISVMVHVLTVFKKRFDPFSVYLSLGCLAGILSMMMHGIIESNFASGANGLYFFFMLGLVVSAVNTRFQHGVEGTRLPRVRYRRMYMSLSAGLLFLTLLVQAGVVTANISSARSKNVKLSPWSSKDELTTVRKESSLDCRVDPIEARHYFRNAGALLYLGEIDNALAAIGTSVKLFPLSSQYLEVAGQIYNFASESGKAKLLLKASVMMEPANPERYKAYASWLIDTGDLKEAINILRQAISLDSNRTREFISFMLLHGMDYKQQREALPLDAAVYFLFADHLAETGKKAKASDNYLNAQELLERGQRLPPEPFIRAAKFFMRQGSPELSMEFMKKSLSHWPDNPHVRTMMGLLYERMEMPYSAAQEYKRALDLSPGFYQAIEGFKRLEGDQDSNQKSSL